MRRKTKKTGYKRTEEQHAYDIQFCTKLFLRGYSYREIADALNKDVAARGLNYTVCFQMIHYDMSQCLIEWKRERLDTIDEYVTQELRKLDAMEQQAWEAWEASKRDKKRIKRNQDEDGSEITTETSAGNPKFLDILLNIQQRRAKMLGFDAPTKIEIPGVNAPAGSNGPKYDVKAIPDDLLFAVVDKLQAAEFAKAIEEKGEAK